MAQNLKMQARPAEIRAARKKLGYTQEDVADLLSATLEIPISVDSYKKWESNRKVDLKLAKVIATILEQPVSKVFRSADRRVKFGADFD